VDANPQQDEASRRLEELRRALARYRAARQRTHQVIMHSGKLPPKEAARRAHAMRDPDTERKAAQSLVDVNRLMLGRDPSEAELEVGVPGLGIAPLLIAIPALIGGTWSATALFNYLSERESRIQRELDPTSILGYGPASMRWLLPAGIGAAALVGGYLWIRSATKKKPKSKPAATTADITKAKKNPWVPPWKREEESVELEESVEEDAEEEEE